MLKRIISGLVCAILFAFLMILSSYYTWVLNISVAIITILAVAEILLLNGELKFSALSVVSLLFAPIKAILGNGAIWKLAMYSYILASLIFIMKQFITNRHSEKCERKSIGKTCFAFILIYITMFALSEIIKIRNFGNSKGIFYVCLAIGIAWTCDVGAYFGGMIFGKNKLCPDVSPHKTVEGAIGGTIFSFLFAILFGVIFEHFFNYREINYFSLSFMAILGAPIAIFGDLCFSLIKRSANIKDFGDIIPGHGGILDRFDSIIFTIPYVYLYLRFIPIFLN
ncbi:MAG: phosphatidate cytidylyltransferase [Oscillospiraceae bacterium]|nr:phosphatidate cytidylyltransferase [Oscillospiraceae bacterium]